MTTNDFDPQEPYVDEKGFEYRNFAAYLAGERLQNGRNRKIEGFWDWTNSGSGGTNNQDYYDEWIWSFYVYYNEDGDPLAHTSIQGQEQSAPGWLEKRLERVPKAAARRFRAAAERRFRAGAERRRANLVAQTARPAGRDGGPCPQPAQAAAIHPADEPQVPRGVGA